METSSDTLIFYEFSRSKVERGDFSHFLGHFALEKLPTGRKLRQMMGATVLCIGGYDEDPRELYTISAVRTFYRKLNSEWPYAFYFSNLDQGGLKIMTYCCIDKLTDMKTDGDSKVFVRPDPIEMAIFLSRGFGAMNQICDRANMFSSLVCQRTNTIGDYYGLPNDAEVLPSDRN